MASRTETQEERTRRVKEFLKTKPGIACNMLEICRATGIPKARIDYERMLSSDPEIERTEATSKHGVLWTYVGLQDATLAPQTTNI